MYTRIQVSISVGYISQTDQRKSAIDIPAKPLHNHETVSVHFNQFIAWSFVTN